MSPATILLRVVVCGGATPQVIIGTMWIGRISLSEDQSCFATLLAALLPIGAVASVISAFKGDARGFRRQSVIILNLVIFAFMALISSVIVARVVKEGDFAAIFGNVVYFGLITVPFLTHTIALALLSRLERTRRSNVPAPPPIARPTSRDQ